MTRAGSFVNAIQGVVRVFVFDPFGNRIELMEPVK
jgi:hypothetical protein